MNLLHFTVSMLFLLAMIPVAVFCAEVVLGCLPRQLWPGRTTDNEAAPRPRLAVLIPAHNEVNGIQGTLISVQAQLQPHDRVLVVADHCTDATAQIARARGAEVIERQNSPQRGKGYALAFGLEHLQADPPEVVVFIDADCRLAPNTLTHLAGAATQYERPVQGLNLCVPPAVASHKHLLSGLAFRFKNLIRMQGMTRLGGPCHLTGTGMALPWKLISLVPWASGNVVEDMQLGIDYTAAGYPPRFVPEAEIRSELPSTEQGLLQQRRRWEHGFLATASRQAPRLLARAWQQSHWSLFVLALDMLVPPLALLTVWLIGCSVAAVACWLFGYGALPLKIVALANSLGGFAFVVGWFLHCRELVPLRVLLTIPQYIWAKLPLYTSFLTKRETSWVRAQRSA
jgi:cellulose synthase/poly-beta-1,6-N-acetylglucosamine synthase-like glycosyltransferase